MSRLPLIVPAALAVLSLVGCSGRRREPAVGPTHPHLAEVDYSWIHRGFHAHPWLRLDAVVQREHALPGKAVVDLRLTRAQPEGFVRAEIQRLHDLAVAPDRRAVELTYRVRGLGGPAGAALTGAWRRGRGPIHWGR